MKQDDLAKRAQRFDDLVGPALALRAPEVEVKPGMPAKRRGLLGWLRRWR